MPAVAAVGVTAKCDLQKDATSTPDWSVSGCVTRVEGLVFDHYVTLKGLAKGNRCLLVALFGTAHHGMGCTHLQRSLSSAHKQQWATNGRQNFDHHHQHTQSSHSIAITLLQASGG
jgi:hypothetical protein